MPLERETGERFVEEVSDEASACLDLFPHVIPSPRVAVRRFTALISPQRSSRWTVTFEYPEFRYYRPVNPQ